MNNCELAKVFIQSYENPILLMGMNENFVISRILWPITGPDRVVPSGLKCVADDAGNTGINEQFHEAGSEGQRSTRSCPTSRLAYSRQA
jgi:hypothetical protein